MVSRAWFVVAVYLIITIVILLIVGGCVIDYFACGKKRARRDADRYYSWWGDQLQWADKAQHAKGDESARLATFQHMTILQFARYRLDFKIRALGHRLVRQHKEP